MTPSPSTDHADTLREQGLRVTRQRVAVMSALAADPHSGAEAVLARVRADFGRVSHQGVYDVLHALTDAGLLRCIEPAGHAARYERRVADNHHHVVCRGCGAIDDVDCAVGPSPCLTPSSTSGFTVETAEVTYWGLCPACQGAG